MPGQPSIFPTVSSIRKMSPYMESYPSTSTLNGYSRSLSSPTNTVSSLSSVIPRSTFSSGLPPSVSSAQHFRRTTPLRRSYTSGLDVPSERKPVTFHTRPLRSLTVLSDTPSRDAVVERSVTRSPSPALSNYSVRSGSSVNSNRSRRSTSYCPPRRTFPQSYEREDLVREIQDKEESPVVFDANLTFVLGCKGKLKQNFIPIPAHQENETASNALSNKISDFLSRTDHVMDEWKSKGHKEDEQHSLRMKKHGGKFLGKSNSATNIMIKGFQYFSRANSSSRSSIARDVSDVGDDATEYDEVRNIKLLNTFLG